MRVRNQCDGCRRGLPIKDGIHYGETIWDKISCTKDRYLSYHEFNLIKRYKINPSRKNAINAFCFSCFGGTIDDLPDTGYRLSIRGCTSTDCPLYKYRPFK